MLPVRRPGPPLPRNSARPISGPRGKILLRTVDVLEVTSMETAPHAARARTANKIEINNALSTA
jgi:hypothetical protein